MNPLRLKLQSLLFWFFCSTAACAAEQHGVSHRSPDVNTDQHRAAHSHLAYVLLGSGTRNDLLVTILQQLKVHLLPWTPGDVLFFHTGEYDSPGNQSIVTRILPDAQLLRIPAAAWELPADLSEADAPSWWYAPCCPFPQHGVGYRHMCRWYSNGLFHWLARRGYRWVLRLDEDSEVLSPVRQDMVAWMVAHGKQYGYRLWDEDDPEVVWSLAELTAWYLTANSIQPHWLYASCRPRSAAGLHSRGGWDRRVIYNNMFMANVTWWLSQEVQRYLEVLDRSRGVYLFRWGDAPVHTLVVKTFLRRDQVHRFGFEYAHKGNHDPQRHAWWPDLRTQPP
ncbi:nucleotide-diphospho-sugar transferase [Haematococcus lacustris]